MCEQCPLPAAVLASRSGLNPTALGKDGAGHTMRSLHLCPAPLPPSHLGANSHCGGNNPGELGNEKLYERNRTTEVKEWFLVFLTPIKMPLDDGVVYEKAQTWSDFSTVPSTSGSLQLWILPDGSDEKAPHHRTSVAPERLAHWWDFEEVIGQKKIPKPPNGSEVFSSLRPEYCGFPIGLGLDQIHLFESTSLFHGNLARMHF